MTEPRFEKCYPEGGNVRETNTTATPSGMRPETIAYLKSIVENCRSGSYDLLRDLAAEILEMEGIKHE